MALDRYLSLTEIGERTGLGRRVVSWCNWQAKERRVTGDQGPGDMPPPVVYVGTHPGWDEGSIQAWIAAMERHGGIERRKPGRPARTPVLQETEEKPTERGDLTVVGDDAGADETVAADSLDEPLAVAG